MSAFKVILHLWTVLTVINKYNNYTYRKYKIEDKIAKVEN
jgi:hypothetical protein